MIYYIQDRASGRIKIGFSDNPWNRLAKINTDAAGGVLLLAVEDGCRAVEASRHASFSADRGHGEWFAPSSGLLAHIEALPKVDPPVAKWKTKAFWNGLTSQEVARLVGCSKATISDIRSGKKRPSPELALRIQEVTGLSAVRLVFGFEAT